MLTVCSSAQTLSFGFVKLNAKASMMTFSVVPILMCALSPLSPGLALGASIFFPSFLLLERLRLPSFTSSWFLVVFKFTALILCCTPALFVVLALYHVESHSILRCKNCTFWHSEVDVLEALGWFHRFDKTDGATVEHVEDDSCFALSKRNCWQ